MTEEDDRALLYRQNQTMRLAAQAQRQAALSGDPAAASTLRANWAPWTDVPKPGEELEERGDWHGGNRWQQANG